MLSDKDITEFQQIFKKTFNKELEHSEATLMAQEIYELYRAVYLPVESEELLIKQNNERRNTNQ